MSIVENLKFTCLIFVSILISSNLFAESIQWQQNLNSQLLNKWRALSGHSSVDAKIQIENLPASYTLPTCQNTPKIQYTNVLKPGRNAIRLVCNEPFWQQNLSVRMMWFRHVAYFVKPVRAKQVLKADDIHMVKQDVGALNHGYFVNKSDLIGMVSRRQFDTGSQIYPSMLDPKIVIQRGQTVTIRLQKSKIKIEVQGKALSDGHLNQKIRVKNNRSKKIIFARVISSGIVQID